MLRSKMLRANKKDAKLDLKLAYSSKYTGMWSNEQSK